MKNQAFTLIELLVVVLIIGILAAIAVPQYQVAVVKSRYATLKSLVKSIAEAQSSYYLANNIFADSFDKLDISMPSGRDEEQSTPGNYVYSWGYCHFGGSANQVVCYNSAINMQYQLYPNTNQQVCVSFDLDINSAQNKVCMQETGIVRDKCNHTSSGYCNYVYPN